ncbi:vancomycin aglycone glucosyltransferase [Streptosporangium becharense]|uniref:Vancomycin aglycone glucosyltransferase n=1 Tax=Streptosporangium becharense TaxID=1816182 RepID=A0A7W9MGV1_9ACTN|nr:glycosyltransferase [Streptosporangium becharense]MBB2912674.1 vancomycin aglycone glucosyltransferase [Streptosporangium becharense]MBB5820497.1 vancomycin aglycone glucosyltransferase [Streptosporangium becharense]
MRVLLSTIGSRGDVQPLVALALELRNLGQEVHLCVPPDFRDWIDSLAIPVTPIGPELRQTAAADPPATPAPPSPEHLRQLAQATVTAQFEAVAAAAEGCDVIVAATALQVAAHSVAELMAIPYVFAAYCPAVLPSPRHAPPSSPMTVSATADNRELWARDRARFNDMFGAVLNSHRTSVGLAPVGDVRSHILTDRPWLAADPTLAPWPEPANGGVVQTGAWILPDRRPLPPELVAFLQAGEPPVYFGLGSMRAPRGLSQAMIGSARALGRRAIVSRGWAGLSPVDDAPDCLSIGEVNHQELFEQVAAVVHHGGAGTTTAAARAGAPQVVIPQVYDQYYWAQRVDRLGNGTAHPPVEPTADSLATALGRVLRPDVAARAQVIADAVRTDGARVTAQRLMTSVLQKSFRDGLS